MIVFPNCKINLGLNIIRKRKDGFHDLETVFYPLPLFDTVEVIQLPEPSKQQDDILFDKTGFPIEGIKENNLCIKAYQLLKKDFPALSLLQMHLHKAIPMGAGLGGGSADGAFTLLLLNKIFQLNLSTNQLLNYSLQLGSDCPFFIINKPCFASGRGELLKPVTIDLSMFKFVLVNPGIHIHTANIFSLITPALPGQPVREVIQEPVTAWKDKLKNDFEEAVFNQYPGVIGIKEELYDAGAIYASMSGSGSTVYGIFEKKKKLRLRFPSRYFVKELHS